MKSRRGQAEQAASGDIVPGNEPVYLVVLTGQFVAADVSRPVGGQAPHGRVATFSFALGTHEVMDAGLQNRMPDLSALGPVHSLDTVCGSHGR